MAAVTLSNGIRTNLIALNRTKSDIAGTEEKLSTGKAVSTPLDDAFKFFTAKSLADRSSDLSARKDSISQAVSSVSTATTALGSIEQFLQQMKGISDQSRSGTKQQRGAYAAELKELVVQIGKMVNDASYNGQNLLNSSTSSLSVYFSDKASSKLTVQGVNYNISTLFIDPFGFNAGIHSNDISDYMIGQLGNFTNYLSAYQLSTATELAKFNSHCDHFQTSLDNTIQKVRSQAAIFGTNVSILNVRLDFTSNYINTLQGGSDKLTVADLNAESASLMAMNTRQSLATSALSMANQADQGVLQLLR